MKKNLVQYIKEIRDKMENLEESQKKVNFYFNNDNFNIAIFLLFY